MTFPDNSGASKLPKRPDEDLPWILDSARLENWSDTVLYDMEVNFREWLFKAIDSPSWKVPYNRRKNTWNVGSRMTFNKVREQFGIGPRDRVLIVKLQRICKHYAVKIKHKKNPIEVGGKKQSQTGYYFPRDKAKVKLPYNLKLRFELLMAEGKEVRDLRSLPNLDNYEKTLVEMDQTRMRINEKKNEYNKRWQAKYGPKGTHRRTTEDTDSGSGLES